MKKKPPLPPLNDQESPLCRIALTLFRGPEQRYGCTVAEFIQTTSAKESNLTDEEIKQSGQGRFSLKFFGNMFTWAVLLGLFVEYTSNAMFQLFIVLTFLCGMPLSSACIMVLHNRYSPVRKAFYARRTADLLAELCHPETVVHCQQRRY